MNHFKRFCSDGVGALLAVLVVGGLGGCALPMRCGDARVTYPRHDFFLGLASLGMIRDGYAVDLPAISLSREGITEFHLSKLPAGSYEYRFYLTGGSIYGDGHGFYPAPATASHAKTVASFRAVSLDGKQFFSRDVRLGDLQWFRDKSKMEPAITIPKITATDFRLIVTVRHPSSEPYEKMHIDGFGGGPEVGPVEVKPSGER